MAGTSHGVLVGYDGSVSAQDALAWAASEAQARREALTVCQAWTPGYPALPDEVIAGERARRYGERSLASGVLLAQTLWGTGDVRSLLLGGSAASVLCEQGAHASMVVVGSRGHSGLAGLLMGSVSLQVAAYASAPVVVVRGQWPRVPGQAPRPIVAGSDGSTAAGAAVGYAFRAAALHHTWLLAVCALADAPGSLGGAHQIRDDFDQQIGRWEKKYPEIAVHRQVTNGAARPALLDAAREAQMLVLGSRGRGGVRGMALGSVSHALLHHAACPVCIVHPQ